MVTIKWCWHTKNGLEIIDPNKNMSLSYLAMAEESLKVLASIQESKIWIATSTYYIFYYSLYAFMLRLGVKCEIHACSLEFMKRFLVPPYHQKDVAMIEKAFKARTDLQYYADRAVDPVLIQETRKYCSDFYVKTKDILSTLSEDQITALRNKVQKFK